MVERISRFSFADTVARLSAAIVAAGSTIFTIIDQSAAAAGAGLTLRPTSLIVFGNPKGGTLLMQAHPLVALDLPLKLLVWEERAVVRLAYRAPAELAVRYSISGQDALLGALEHLLEGVVASVA